MFGTRLDLLLLLLLLLALCEDYTVCSRKGKKVKDNNNDNDNEGGSRDTRGVFADGGRKQHPYRYVIGSPKRYEAYDYQTISAKLTETIDPACGDVSNEGANLDPDFLSLQMYRPTQTMIDYWTSIPPPLTMIDSEICEDSPKFFQRTGCSKGIALHPDSPRCHRETTKIVCDALATGDPLPMNETIQSRKTSEAMLTSSTPFILKVGGGGVVSECGGVALPCGSILTRAGCGAIKKEPELKTLRTCLSQKHNDGNKGLDESSECVKGMQQVDTVFVLSYMYDSAVGHFLTEVLPRVIYHLDFLKHDHVKIHYGCDKKYKKFGPSLRFLEWVGFTQGKTHYLIYYLSHIFVQPFKNQMYGFFFFYLLIYIITIIIIMMMIIIIQKLCYFGSILFFNFKRKICPRGGKYIYIYIYIYLLLLSTIIHFIFII